MLAAPNITPRKAADASRAGILFIISGAAALLLITAAEALYPNYSVKADSISMLAATNGPTAIIGEAGGFI
jgi:hypothetical membrane protein